MGLYQRSVLKNYLSALDDVKVNAAYNEFKTFFFNPVTQQNIRNSKEEQFQEGFLRELFVKIMGYTLNPDANYNLISEQKNVSDAKKADGAILIDGKVVGVIELKGTNTIDLGKIQQQAFYYLSSHPEAVYVITSNFEKLRFYIQKSNDYEEFNLFTLTLEEFKLLYLCTSLDSISHGLPLKIKQESLVKEDVITKQLYKDYSSFKSDLFSSLCDRNSQIDKLTLFKATQKLIDRFLFIFFCEDNNGLLPANLIRTIVNHWNKNREYDDYKPLYEIFKKYFSYINIGSNKVGSIPEIFAYNGGLFAEDVLLDKLDIDDNVLYTHTQKLSAYDFISEVDVNILGHIFEHSLNDIEEIQAEIAGNVVDKSKTKRKKDGVFYTPKYITEYIVENTIGKLCADKKAALEIDEDLFVTATTKAKREPLLAKLNAYKSYLLSITICDPACGSGAFLNQAYVFLQKEHQYVADLESKLFDAPMVISDVSADILENNLFGVDINEESVEIARLALWLRSAKKGRKLNNLSNNIKCGNSLIDDPEVAGDKAFNWEKEFPQVFANGGFDVVIGNPPYATKIFTSEEKNYYKNSFIVAQYQLDLYILFMQKGTDILNNNSYISYITPNSWLKNLMMSDCRQYLLENLTFEIILPNLPNVFVDASVDSMIFIGKKAKEMNSIININEIVDSIFITKHVVDQNTFYNNDKYIFNVEANDKIIKILQKLNSQSEKLENYFEISRGINPYDKYRGQSKEIIESKAYHANFKKDDTFVPEIRGKNINRYFYNWDGFSHISYGPWLAASRDEKYFNGERIVFRQVLGERLICTVIEEELKIDQSIFIAKPIGNDIGCKYVICFLGSKLGALYFKYTCNEFDELFPKIKLGEFKNLPVKVIEIHKQAKFVLKAEIMINFNKLSFNKQSKFISRIKSSFNIENITGKLEKFYEYDFKSFVGELKKQKVILSLKDQDEWEDYFNTYKQEINILQAEIVRTDKEIDQMVYELYGLTDEEIRVVEGN